MTAYLVAIVRVDDAEAYRNYTDRAPAVLARYGGRYIVRGGKPELLEGTLPGQRVVVVEFPDIESARAFYASDEYKEVKRLRTGAGEAVFALVEGVEQGEDGPPPDGL
ncbi:MAG: DUF1330 domain-containing protein [Azospirillaceae bacterium]